MNELASSLETKKSDDAEREKRQRLAADANDRQCKNVNPEDQLLASRQIETYQVQVSLKGTELLGAKVLGQDRSREVSDISNAKGLTRIRPEDYLGVISRCGQQLSFALKHLVKTAGELLWNPSLSRSRIMQGDRISFDNRVIRHDGGMYESEWESGRKRCGG